MAGKSDIEWTDTTWNPVAGCTMVSPGCTNCYAMRMAARLEAMGQRKYLGTTRKSGGRSVWTGVVGLDERALGVPATWTAPKRIFVNSMSDLFQEAVPVRFIRLVWEAMAQAPWHTFQILTKRPDRMADILSSPGFRLLPHVWLGTSIENADHLGRLDQLRRTPAAVRFLSFEPLIGPVGNVDLTNVDWAIVGGESGPGARAMQTAWVEEIKAACEDQSVAFFFKQWGGWGADGKRRAKRHNGRELHGKTWDQMPSETAAE